MTKAITDAARAMTYIEDGEYEEFAVAALCAALPVEPPDSAIREMEKAYRKYPIYSYPHPMEAAYLALRAHLLGEDA